jgi:hypothetical protein
VNRSLTVPPLTLRKALPARPWKKRAIMIVSIFFATAHGMIQMAKTAKETR